MPRDRSPCRSVLKLDDLSPGEIRLLLRLAAELTGAKAAGTEVLHLARKNIALIFKKDSTRTRTGFEVAAYDQGARVTYLGPLGSQIGHKESGSGTVRGDVMLRPQTDGDMAIPEARPRLM